MSQHMILGDKQDTLNIFPTDSGVNLFVEKLPGSVNIDEGLKLTIMSYTGKYDQEEVVNEIYLFGRNLEVFREFIAAKETP